MARIGEKIKTRDFRLLPEGSWVQTRTGTLIETKQGYSIVNVLREEPEEYVCVSPKPGEMTLTEMRKNASNENVEPHF